MAWGLHQVPAGVGNPARGAEECRPKQPRRTMDKGHAPPTELPKKALPVTDTETLVSAPELPAATNRYTAPPEPVCGVMHMHHTSGIHGATRGNRSPT